MGVKREPAVSPTKGDPVFHAASAARQTQSTSTTNRRPASPWNAQSANGSSNREGWPAAEIIAACRNAMDHLGGPELTSLGVTSVERGEGRSTLAIAAAIVQSQEYGRRTLIVEFDIERPSMAQRFHIPSSPGLIDMARGAVTPNECIHVVGANLGVVVAGDVDEVSPSLGTTIASSAAITKLRATADAFICDLPPVMTSELGVAFTGLVEPIVLVVRAGSTRLADVRRAAGRLKDPTPTIINGVQADVPNWWSTRRGV